MKSKTYYYKDEINDDFAKLPLKRPKIDENYKFIRKSKINNFLSFILFYLIVKPILILISFVLGVKVEGKNKLKYVRKNGIFIYANHTSYLDAFIIQARVINFKRTNIVGYSDTTALPIIKHIARACGYIPIPSTLKGTQKFMEAVEYYINKGEDILIYPEAHIWPTYTKIRQFSKTSFHYPAKLNAPIIPIVTVYRKSKFSNRPKMTLVVGDIIYPINTFDEAQNKAYLRDECYNQMVKISSSYDQYEFNKFIKKEI